MKKIGNVYIKNIYKLSNITYNINKVLLYNSS